MKKTGRIAISIVGVFLLVVWYVYTLSSICRDGDQMYTRICEYACYTIWGFIFAELFYAITQRFKRIWIKIAVGSLVSLIFTATLFLANNLCRYAAINARFGGCIFTSYASVLKIDIDYGLYRYLGVFSLMLMLCMGKLLLTQPRAKAIYGSLAERLKAWFWYGSLSAEMVEDIYCGASEDMFCLEWFFECVQNMPRDESYKKMLISCIEKHPDWMLVRLLLHRFGELMTREEYTKYRELYMKTGEEYIGQKSEYYNSLKENMASSLKELDARFSGEEKE